MLVCYRDRLPKVVGAIWRAGPCGRLSRVDSWLLHHAPEPCHVCVYTYECVDKIRVSYGRLSRVDSWVLHHAPEPCHVYVYTHTYTYVCVYKNKISRCCTLCMHVCMSVCMYHIHIYTYGRLLLPAIYIMRGTLPCVCMYIFVRKHMYACEREREREREREWGDFKYLPARSMA